MANDGLITIGVAVDDSQWTRTLRNLASNSGRTINQAINAHIQPLGRITGEANEFQKSLAASNARVIAFGASTGGIFAMKAAFQQLLRATIDVEKQMTEINSVFQLGGTELKRLSSDIFNIANAYSVAFSEVSKAAGEFARQGLTVEETLKRTSAAVALSRIANVDMVKSVASVTSMLNTFVKEALTAEDIVNRMTAVDQAYAISAGDLAEALSRVSSSAADANVSLNETMALITAAKQITARTGSVIGNSFKTMFTRLQRPQVIADLEAVGVEARTAEGRLRPMMDILRSLATTYDSLGASQRSFIAETVGGVYQINVLKAILRDLGSGMSIVDGAMSAAANSSDFVQKRMAILNDTISSQLIRTTNSLSEAFSHMGTALFSSTIRTGLGSFEKIAGFASKYSNPAITQEGTSGEKAIGTISQGMLKGVGAFVRGPGVQFMSFVILKLLQRLRQFVFESVKDLTEINKAEKERKAINEGIAEWLGAQKGLLQEILSGQTSINDAAKMYLETIKDTAAVSKDIGSIAAIAGEKIAPQIKFERPGAASGYIPNLEISEARRGGYQAGHVLNTVINNGLQRMAITANAAETITRVQGTGGTYDFVNPPLGSIAGRRHQIESVRQTGIDPYSLPNFRLRGQGFIPNLALSPELIQTIINLGIKPEDILKKGNATKISDFHALPQNLVAAFVSRYRHDPNSLTAALASLVRRGAANIPSDATGLYNLVKGFALNASAVNRGLYPDLRSIAAVQSFVQSIAGGEVKQSLTQAQRAAKFLHLRPEDVQKVLDLHARSIPTIAAYEHSSDVLTAAQDRPNLVSLLEMQPEGGSLLKFKVPTPIYGYKGASKLMETFNQWKDKLRATLGSNAKDFPVGQLGTMRGNFFELALRTLAQEEGIEVEEDEHAANASLDIHGAPKSILSQTSIRHGVSALELKASALEAVRSGNIAQKIFRTLAGEPGGKGKPALKGPVGYVPPLTNIRAFDPTLGSIGIIDADKFGEGDKSVAHYQALIYAAVASGKPLRIHYGPMTTGKTTAAENIVRLAGKGGGYITDISQIDSDEYKQFIINKTDRKNLDTGVFGLALSAASQIRAFYHPYSSYEANRDEMVKRLQARNRGQEGTNAEAIAHTYSQEAWEEYGLNVEKLRRKFGSRFQLFDPSNPLAASGFIPNLSADTTSIRRADVKRALSMLGEAMYQQDLPSTITKEAVQNALDAISMSSSQKIGIGFSPEKSPRQRIIVKDSGIGMLPRDVLTKLLPGFTSGKEGQLSRGQFGLAKIALLGAAQRFTISSIAQNEQGQFIKTLVMGQGSDWMDFAGAEGNIAIPKDFGPDGHMEFGGLHITWMPTAQTETGTTYRITLPEQDRSGERMLASSAYFTQQSIERGFRASNKEGILRELSPSGKRFLGFAFSSLDDEQKAIYRGIREMERYTPPGAIVRVLYNPKSNLRPTYGIPLLNNGLYQINSGFLSERPNLPEGFAIDIQPNVGVDDSNYPWTTNRDSLKGPAASVVAQIIESAQARSKENEIRLLSNALSSGVEIGTSGVQVLDLSQLLPPEFMKEIASNPHMATIAAKIQKHFLAMRNEASRRPYLGGKPFESAKFGGMVLGADFHGVRLGKAEAGSPGLIFANPFSILSLSEIDDLTSEADIGLAYGQTVGGVLLHELTHQVTSSEGEGHARQMVPVSGRVSSSMSELSADFQKLGSTNPETIRELLRLRAKYLQLKPKEVSSEQFSKLNGGRGFIPNLAVRLGEGAFGAFFDLERRFRGTRIGKKQFHPLVSQKDISREYEMAKALEHVDLHELFAFPKTIGSKERSLARRAVGKEVFPGKTLRAGIMSSDFSLVASPKRELTLTQAHGIRYQAAINIWDFVSKGLLTFAEKSLEWNGIIADDLTNNPGNTLFNQSAIETLLRLYRHPRRWQAMLKAVKQGGHTRIAKIANMIAKRGGKLGLIDPGIFRRTGEEEQEYGSNSDSDEIVHSRSDDKFSAFGFVPNLSIVSEALARENRATGGHAVLSSHPLLRTYFNPLGIAAIDKRNQNNAFDAISQHQILGQSLPEIRRARSARGFVPNLAMPTEFSAGAMSDVGGLFGSSSILNSILLALLSNRGHTGESTSPMWMEKSKFQGFLRFFTSEGEQAASKLRYLGNEFNKMREQVRRGEPVQMPLGGKWIAGGERNIPQLEEAFKKLFEPLKKVAEPYQEAQAARSASFSKMGIKLAAISSFGGGIASQLAELSSPSMGAAVSEFTSGLTMAGQILVAFPSQLGAIAATGTALSSMVSAADLYSKGIHSARKMLELANNNYQRLVAQLDTLTASLSQYDMLVGDASVSFEVIERENRKYSETLAQMALRPESRDIAQRLSSAPNTQARLRLLTEEKERATREQNLLVSIRSLSEYGSKRAHLWGLTEKLGVNPFGFKLQTEGVQLEQGFRGTAGDIIANMPAELKNMFGSIAQTGMPKDFNKILREAMRDADEEISDSATRLKMAFDDLAKSTYSSTGGDRLKNLIMRLLRAEQEAARPETVKRQTQLRGQEASYESLREAAINEARNAQRIFINTGSLIGENILNLRAMRGREELNKALVSGPDSIVMRKGMASILRDQYGARTVRKYEYETEVRNAQAESRAKMNQIQIGIDRNFLNHFRQTFESNIKKLDTFKASPEGMSLPNMNAWIEKYVTALNRGLVETMRQGNILRFKTASGAFDFNKLFVAVSKASSSDANMQQKILATLRGGNDETFMASILNGINEIAMANQEGNAQIQRLGIENFFNSFEAEFKRLSNYLGGIKGLLDRSTRRTLMRNLVRGSTLMETGRTPEARAMGAATLLSTLKEMEIPIDLSGKSPLSQAIQRAWSVGISNFAIVQRQTMGQVLGPVAHQTGPFSIATRGMQDLSRTAGVEAAAAAFRKAFLPEVDPSKIPGFSQSSSSIQQITDEFAKNLKGSSSALEAFSNSLGDTAEAARTAAIHAQDVQQQTSQAVSQLREEIRKLFPKEPPTTAEKRALDATGGVSPDTGTQSLTSGLATVAPWAAMIGLTALGWKGKTIMQAVRRNSAQKAAQKSMMAAAKLSKSIGENTSKELASESATALKSLISKEALSGAVQAQGAKTAVPSYQALARFKTSKALQKTVLGKTSEAVASLSRSPVLGKIATNKAAIPLALAVGLGGGLLASSHAGEEAVSTAPRISNKVISSAAKPLLKSFGPMMAIDTASGMARPLVEKKYGYTAGISQSLGASIASGATVGGPIGTLIGFVTNLASEVYERKGETDEALSQQAVARRFESGILANELGNVNATNVTDKLSQAQMRLTARINELNNLKLQDEKDYQGLSGRILKVFSGKQFSQTAAQELNSYTQQSQALSQAASSGDIQKMIAAVQALQDTLMREVRGESASPLGVPANSPVLQSEIKIDISLKDTDKIPEEIRNGVIEPLRKQLTDLQLEVNALINEKTPKPALVY